MQFEYEWQRSQNLERSTAAQKLKPTPGIDAFAIFEINQGRPSPFGYCLQLTSWPTICHPGHPLAIDTIELS